jgi:hypothetical protein
MQISECEQQARQCRKMAAEMNDSTHKKQMEVLWPRYGKRSF